MLVRLGWPDCNPSEYGLREVSEPVDAFWVECTPDEASKLVEPLMSEADLPSIEKVRVHYGWPHRFEGADRCCFLVARDLSFIQAFHAHYPFHQLWNAYSPFRAVPETTIETLDQIAGLPKPARELEFNEWVALWIELASYTGTRLPDEEERIAAVVALWHQPIPSGWERGQDSRLLDRRRRYGRGTNRDDHAPHGEWLIEYEVLNPSPRRVTTTCLGARLVDGVNAVPLTKDAGGGREGNVEADMLLLVRDERGYRLQLFEVKARRDNAWFAAVENLRQLKLFLHSRETQLLFHSRCHELDLPQTLPVTAAVLARHEFYTAPGQKAESVAPAQNLLQRMRAEADVDARLATWKSDTRVIAPV